MSIWLWIALVAYSLGAILQWLQFSQKFLQFNEYTNFPIVWVAKVVTVSACIIEALIWPFSLILSNELVQEKDL
jgi:fumarate reductase subunit C